MPTYDNTHSTQHDLGLGVASTSVQLHGIKGTLHELGWDRSHYSTIQLHSNHELMCQAGIGRSNIYI
jgi:hypothetical protein